MIFRCFCAGKVVFQKGASATRSDSISAIVIRERAMAEAGIGYFGDERLKKNSELIVQGVVERQEVCVCKLGDDRPEQVKFRRAGAMLNRNLRKQMHTDGAWRLSSWYINGDLASNAPF
jgi:hypothetical protein